MTSTTVSMGGANRIRVGIIGANPDRGWAAQAHIPALRSLSDDFEITALSTSRRESANAAGKVFGVVAAFDNHHELVNSPAVDVVAVTVKVPYHLELATAALEARKAVYCEWPLGNGLNETETLAALAKKQGVLAVPGLQARSAPAVAYVRDLIEQGYVGEVLSTTLIGSGMGWGPTVEPFNAYLNDKKNGATMLSIALGHTADALCYCLGEVRELSATMAVRRKTFTIAESGETKPMTADDQVGVSGLLEGGAAFSIHYRGGVSRGTNLLWEINGTEGDLQLTATGGQAQIWEMDVRGGRGAQSSLELLPVSERYRWSPPQVPGPSTNVAQAYAHLARDSRGNAPLSYLRRRGHTPSHAGRRRDGRGDRSASNAPLRTSTSHRRCEHRDRRQAGGRATENLAETKSPFRPSSSRRSSIWRGSRGAPAPSVTGAIDTITSSRSPTSPN
jgi:predicted dehydrogenase